MNWNAKAAWIYQGNTPDLAKCARHGIGVVYLDPRSTNAATVVANVRSAGLVAGAYFADSWAGAVTGAAYADEISTILNHLLPKGGLLEAPPCMLDIESHPVGWANALLTRYRAHQPGRPTSYTVMPFQGANTPIAALKEYGMHLYVQLYHDEPTQSMVANDPAAVILEAARYGMPVERLHPFYDGARFGSDHRDGCYFTLERMS